jgi:sporulation protein YlmC with PRC-barrel domain
MSSSQEKSYSEDNTSGLNHEGVDANIPVERLTATSIIGDAIENPIGEKLGKVNDLMINIQSGEIEYVVIEFGSFLGVGGKLFAVPLKELRPKPGTHIFIYNRDKKYLTKSPGFDKDHWPGTNDKYYEEVNLYYRLSSEAFVP